jgi:hypothetical protein
MAALYEEVRRNHRDDQVNNLHLHPLNFLKDHLYLLKLVIVRRGLHMEANTGSKLVEIYSDCLLRIILDFYYYRMDELLLDG